VRTKVPFVPLAQAVFAFTALAPRNDADDPLASGTHCAAALPINNPATAAHRRSIDAIIPAPRTWNRGRNGTAKSERTKLSAIGDDADLKVGGVAVQKVEKVASSVVGEKDVLAEVAALGSAERESGGSEPNVLGVQKWNEPFPRNRVKESLTRV
jgi:hypothetical protein